ncbi:MAG: hypothetical protein GKS05_06085 [Nitrospirales bacterium]|nr:hypothetical protein [Nitrospirales bacterium]
MPRIQVSSPVRALPVARVSCRHVALLILCGVGLVLAACLPSMAPFDPVSLEMAQTLKKESMTLIGKATDPPNLHMDAITQVQKKLQDALNYEAAKVTPNEIAVRQWKLLGDPGRNLLGGFLKKWQDEKVGRSPTFLTNVKSLVSRAFDEIIQTENQKPKQP